MRCVLWRSLHLMLQEPLDGAEFLRRVRAEAAELPAVLTSGNHKTKESEKKEEQIFCISGEEAYVHPASAGITAASGSSAKQGDVRASLDTASVHNGTSSDKASQGQEAPLCGTNEIDSIAEGVDTTLTTADGQSKRARDYHRGNGQIESTGEQHFNSLAEWEEHCKHAFALLRKQICMRIRANENGQQKKRKVSITPQRIARQAAASNEQLTSIVWLVARHDPLLTDLLHLSEHEKLALLLMLADALKKAAENEIVNAAMSAQLGNSVHEGTNIQAQQARASDLDVNRASRWAFAILMCIRDVQTGVSKQAINKVRRACVAYDTHEGMPATVHALLCACETCDMRDDQT